MNSLTPEIPGHLVNMMCLCTVGTVLLGLAIYCAWYGIAYACAIKANRQRP